MGSWREDRCRKEGLSLCEAATKIGLSHATIGDIMKSSRACPETIRKLAQTFSQSGGHHRFALEDKLLTLAGYRSKRPQQQDISETLARLMDIVSEFSEANLKIMVWFAEFIAEIEAKR